MAEIELPWGFRRGAASAYVISCLPDLMRPSSALSALLLFVSGMTLGVVALALTAVSHHGTFSEAEYAKVITCRQTVALSYIEVHVLYAMLQRIEP